MANLEYGIPNTPQSRFNIASVSKTFTAAMILLLQEHGKLSVQESEDACAPVHLAIANWK
jgi:CubicO group peptidase (beta-lactamase class C family)